MRRLCAALACLLAMSAGTPALPAQASAASPAQNPLVDQQAVKLIIRSRGIQELNGALLLTAGAPAVELDVLRLWRNGVEVPLELADDGDGRLSAGDTLRFYAPDPGERANNEKTYWRWNNADTYWLVSGGAGLRIPAITPATGVGAARTAATERGIWRQPRAYDSRFGGADRDHWFAKQLPTSFADSQPDLNLTAALAPTLPPASGVARYTVAGTSLTCGTHALQLRSGGAATVQTWFESTASQVCATTRNWRQNFQLDQGGAEVEISVPEPRALGLLIDEIAWELPVELRFTGSAASFATPEAGRYQIAGLPTSTPLYDITNPAAPLRLSLPPDASFQSEAGRSYLIAAAGSAHTPGVQPAPPVDLSSALAAQVVYIAPSAFHAALAPLLAHRSAQGYSVAAVDPQPLYDRWSYGNIDPRAIRNFLQAAASDGSPLVAVTLVGDGTVDPFSQGRNFQPDAQPRYDAARNLDIIPPYLAPVDIVGESACEACYAQLDGDDPQADQRPEIMRPDVMLGRLPVKDAAQLAKLVAKILRYETGPLELGSASAVVFIADDDEPGNQFSAAAAEGIALQPANIATPFIRYTPEAGDTAENVYARSLGALNRGAGAVNYIGHGSIYQWASTDLSGGTLLSLYDPDGLRNGDRMPIVLSLTCATSMFHIPNTPSTSIDERLVLKEDGGAIATWGSSGNGLLPGHAALQRGFYRALWAAPREQATLGALSQASIGELLSTSERDAVWTYLLLGDPLTRARIVPARHLSLPLMGQP
ncbi:MAG: hypothetical protein H7Z42_13180 [Roseiflexaceae bacterium]|nr:hypothetical protein [Roseiflexaceae bacterium]